VQGLGEAADFTQLPWVVEQCRLKLGFEPFPGTVNLQVAPDDMALWADVKRLPGPRIEPPTPAFCEAVCHPVLIAGRPAAILIPHVDGYPDGKLEIVSPVALVAALGLMLGDEISVDLDGS